MPSIQVQRMCGGECSTLFWYPLDDDFGSFNDDDDDEVDRTGQIFNFVLVPLFASLFSGTQMNHLIS